MSDCRFRKGQGSNRSQAHLTETDEVITAVISEINLVSNGKDWIVDIGATKHICYDRSIFSSYEPVKNGEQVFMGNSRSSPIAGKGKVLLKLTSGKVLQLSDVHHVPEMIRNLVSGALLNKVGVKLVFESDKLIFTRNGNFVGKGYYSDGLFVLNVFSVIYNNASTSSSYLIEPLNVWHMRLGHAIVNSIKRMKTLGLISDFSNTNFDKCEACVESKFTRKPFKNIQRESDLLSLIHTDIGDYKSNLTRGGKKYYITFVDDFS